LKRRKNPVRPGSHSTLTWWFNGRWVCVAVFLAASVPAAALQGQESQQSPQSQQSAAQQTNGNASTPDPGRGRTSIASPLAVQASQTGARDIETIVDESARLLKLATDLKAEVDKTTKDTLSISVVRKADEIEKLAHSVKEAMKLNAAPN
jgi:hypothetical protein